MKPNVEIRKKHVMRYNRPSTNKLIHGNAFNEKDMIKLHTKICTL